MRIFVTGGAGYIGSVMTDALVDRGHDVTVFDNLSRGHRDAISDRATFVEGDLVDTPRVLATLKNNRIEAVIHMAGDALVAESMEKPARYYRNNLVAGISLLEAMRDAGVKPIVFSSTCTVYGVPWRTPLDEGMPTRPINPYGESKLAFERALDWFHRAHGLKVVALRYFNAAGAGARSGERHEPETHLIPIVLDVAAGERPTVTIFGDDYPTRDGTCVRDYIHVLDLADAHVRAVEHLLSGGDSVELNLGTGTGTTVKELLTAISEVSGREFQVDLVDRREGDSTTLVANNDKARDILGWVPKYGLTDITRTAWNWHSRRNQGV